MKTEQQVQLENVAELAKLQSENPDARIICFVSEDANNGEHSYMSAKFGKPRLEKLTLHNNVWIDDEEMECKIADNVSEEWHDDLSDQEVESIIEDRLDKVVFEEIIVIYINEH